MYVLGNESLSLIIQSNQHTHGDDNHHRPLRSYYSTIMSPFNSTYIHASHHEDMASIHTFWKDLNYLQEHNLLQRVLHLEERRVPYECWNSCTLSIVGLPFLCYTWIAWGKTQIRFGNTNRCRRCRIMMRSQRMLIFVNCYNRIF